VTACSGMVTAHSALSLKIGHLRALLAVTLLRHTLFRSVESYKQILQRSFDQYQAASVSY